MQELLHAIRDGQTASALAIIGRLQSEGADLDATHPHGWTPGSTPAHLAAEHGHAEVITALQAAGADLNAAHPHGWTPAHLAAWYGHADVITALQAAGADLKAANPDGWTPAHLAAQHGHAEVITALQAAGADLKAANPNGSTPAHLAAMHGHPEVITALQAAGANLNAANPVGRTPAHLAAQHGHVGVIQVLQEAGANLSATDVGGSTPTHVAAASGRMGAISALHAAGANLDTKNADGHTPADVAAIFGRQDVADALISYRESPIMEAVISALEDSADLTHRNLATELTCPITAFAYTTRGDARPVRLPDGRVDAETGRSVPGSVMSASAALRCMRPDVNGDYGRSPPTDPFNRNRFTVEEADAFLASKGFLQGDRGRVALVGAVWEACRQTDRSLAAITAARAAAPGVPQYQAVLDAHAARDPSIRPSGAADRRHDQGGPR